MRPLVYFRRLEPDHQSVLPIERQTAVRRDPDDLRSTGGGAGLLLLGRSLGREGDSLNSLALLALVLVAGRPGMLWGAGFQLSFLACAGIIASATHWARRIPLPGPLALPELSEFPST